MKAFLSSTRQFYRADLYTLTLVGGTVIRYSASETSFTVSGNTYSATKIRFDHQGMKSSIGLQVDQLEIDVYADPNDAAAQISSQPFAQFCRAGGLDGAYILYERLIMPTWGDVSLGTIPMFYGRISQAEPGRTTTKLNVSSLIELLNIKMPRELYGPGCVHTLYDHGCGINKATVAVSGVVSGTPTSTLFNSNLANADGYFDLGMVQFSSGALNNQKRTVKSYLHASGQLAVALPFSAAPAAGDTFTAWPGCDLTQATCLNKFNNLGNFLGFPYVPVAETAR